MKAVVLVAVLAVAALIGAPTHARGSSTEGGPALVVLPETVNRYDTFSVSLIAQPNATFRLDMWGANGFNVAWQNHTDAGGVWRTFLQASYDFGTYTFLSRLANNTTVQASLTVGCDARCTSGILQNNGVQQQQIIYALVQQGVTYGLLLLLAFEIPRSVHYFSRQAKIARTHGQLTLKESLLSPFARIRGHVNGGDQVSDPRNIQNPRIAADLERRRLMEQLHDATDRPFMEWRPGHIDNLRDIWTDLASAWDRQKSIQPAGVGYAKEYVRPKPAAGISDDHAENQVPFTVEPKPKVDGMTDEEMDSFSDRLKALGRKARPHPIRWVVYGIGAGGLIMAALVVLAYQGIYVDALRGLWTPWPSDPWKVLAGLLTFAGALAAAAEWRMKGSGHGHGN